MNAFGVVEGRDTRSYMLIKASPWEMPYHDASSVLGTDASISIYVSDSFEFEAAGAIVSPSLGSVTGNC